MRTAVRALAGIGLLAALATWGCAEPGPPARNVVMIVVDTLRADALGLYGNGRGTSANLDALGTQSLVFESDDYAEMKAARAEARDPRYRGR